MTTQTNTSSPTKKETWNLVIPLGLLALLTILILYLREPPPPPLDSEEEDRPVRVELLDEVREVSLGFDGQWRLEPNAGEAVEIDDLGAVRLRRVRVGLALGPHTFPGATELRASPVDPSPNRPAPSFGMKTPRLKNALIQYRGEMLVKVLPTGRLRVINILGLEDYLAGVIGNEMPLGWNDAAVEAQAIVARTYALTQLKSPQKDFDVFTDTRSQEYRGVGSKDARARAMVQATRGKVVRYRGELVVTYFHSTCGGDTVPATWIFPWAKEDTPPLMGASDCSCQPSQYYRWTNTVDLDEKNPLKLELPLESVSVEHWPRGSYVKSVLFTDASGRTKTVPGWDMRSKLFGGRVLRNYAFDVELAEGGRKLVFSGRGWGHGVGLCQYGAQGFAKQGWSAKRIVEHYYPGAEVTDQP